MTLRKLFLCVAVVGGVVAPAALADENAIRQSGQNTEIRGRVNSPVEFTVTGFLSDTCVFRVAGRRTSFTFDQLRRGAVGGITVSSAQRHSTGRWSFRLRVDGRRINLVGGLVEVVSRNRIVDRDYFVIR